MHLSQLHSVLKDVLGVSIITNVYVYHDTNVAVHIKIYCHLFNTCNPNITEIYHK